MKLALKEDDRIDRFILMNLCIFVVAISYSSAAGLPVAELKRTSEVNFNKEIYPFFKRNCLACHNQSKAKAKLILETADDIRKGSKNGDVIVPGNAEDSLLFTTSAHLEEEFMPPKKNKSKAKNLTPKELALLKLWIDQGAKGSGAIIAEAPKDWIKYKANDPIYALVISPDGRYAACGHGHHIDVYDIKLKKHIERLKDPSLKGAAHLDLVRSLAFNEKGVLVSGGYRVIKIWSPSDVLPKIEKQEIFSEKPKPLISSNKLWKVRLDKESKRFTQINVKSKEESFLDFDKKMTKVILLKDSSGVLLGFEDGVIRHINIQKFEDEKTRATSFIELKGHKGGIYEILMSDEKTFFSTDSKGTIISWDLKAHKQKVNFVHGHGLKYIKLNKTGDKVLTAGEKNKVLLWDINQPKKAIATITEDPRLRKNVTAWGKDKTMTRNSLNRLKRKVTAIEKVIENELKSSEDHALERESLILEYRVVQEKVSEVNQSLNLLEHLKSQTSNDNLLLKDFNSKISKLNKEKDSLQEDEKFKSFKISSLEQSRGRALKMYGNASEELAQLKVQKISYENLIKQIDINIKEATARQKKVAQETSIVGLESFMEGDLFAVAHRHGAVHLYSMENGLYVDTISTGSNLVGFTKKSDDTFVVKTEDKLVLSWPLMRKWNYSGQLGDGKNGELLIDRVTALGFVNENELVSASGIPSRKGQLKKWDLETKSVIAKDLKAHQDLILAIDFSPDKSKMVTCSEDGLANIYESKKLTLENSLEGHSQALMDVSWSKDGRLIATASSDSKIVLWNTDNAEKYKTIKGDKNEVTVVEFLSKDSESLLIGRGAGELKIDSKTMPGKFEYLYSATISPDSSTIIAGGKTGQLKLWDRKTLKLLKEF